MLRHGMCLPAPQIQSPTESKDLSPFRRLLSSCSNIKQHYNRFIWPSQSLLRIPSCFCSSVLCIKNQFDGCFRHRDHNPPKIFFHGICHLQWYHRSEPPSTHPIHPILHIARDRENSVSNPETQYLFGVILYLDFASLMFPCFFDVSLRTIICLEWVWDPAVELFSCRIQYALPRAETRSSSFSHAKYDLGGACILFRWRHNTRACLNLHLNAWIPY